EVRRHLRSCAGCRERFGRLVRLIHEVHTAPLQPIPPATRAHIVAQLAPLPVAIPLAVAQAQPVAVAVPLAARRWQMPRHWYGWAAAAVLCLVVGVGLVALLRSGKGQPEEDRKTYDAGHLAVEDRVLERHLELAETRDPARRLHV